VIDQANRAQDAVKDALRGTRGALRIGNAGPLSHGFMPHCLRQFAARFPLVDVVLTELDLNEHVPGVASGAIHLGFTLSRQEAGRPGLQRYLVVSTPLRVVLGATHVLARRKRLALDELLGQPLLAIGGMKGSSHREYLLDLFRMRGLKPAPIKSVNGYEAFLAMIASGQGVSLLPRMPSIRAIEGLTTRELTSEKAAVLFEAYAVWREPGAGTVLKNFVEILQANTGPQANAQR
jgi:DNA-binding transcriptional LysR family regulator